jgi:hypothetical protein
MPTVAIIGPYRFFFYSNEGTEAPHIHVQRDRMLAKSWLESVSLAVSKRFPAHELQRIERIISDRQQAFLDAWHDFFG